MINLIEKLTKLGFKTKKLSSKRVAVLTDLNRVKVIEELSSTLDAKYDPRPIPASSIGSLLYNGLTLLVKPLSKQGRGSPGVQNEDALFTQINQFLNNSVKDIVFLADNKVLEIKDCCKVRITGGNTKNRQKADLVLTDIYGKEFKLSIKMDSAEIWESSDSYFSEEASQIVSRELKKGSIQLEEINDGIYRLVPNIVLKPTKQEIKDVVFGSDIYGNGAIITRTFTSRDFSVNGTNDTLEINCSHIITEMEDIDESKDVYFLIRNDRTRSAIKDYPGLRALAVYKSRVSSKVKLIDRI